MKVYKRIEFLRDNLAALVPRAVPAVDAMVLERLVGRYVADLDTDFASVPAAAAVPSVSTSGSPHACELAT